MIELKPSDLTGWISRQRLDKSPAELTPGEVRQAAAALGVRPEQLAPLIEAHARSNRLAGALNAQAQVNPPQSDVYGTAPSLPASAVLESFADLAHALSPTPPDGAYSEGWDRSYRLTAARIGQSARALAEKLPESPHRDDLVEAAEELRRTALEGEEAAAAHPSVLAAAQRLAEVAASTEAALPAEQVVRQLANVVRGSTQLSTEFHERVEYLASQGTYTASALWSVTPDWGALAKEVAAFSRAVAAALERLDAALPHGRREAVHAVADELRTVDGSAEYQSVMDHVLVLADQLEGALSAR
jgi:hypothetical protein